MYVLEAAYVVQEAALWIKIVPPLHSSGRYLYYSCCRKMSLLISQVRQTWTGILFINKKQRAKPLQFMRKDTKIFYLHKFSEKMSNCSIQNSKGNLRKKQIKKARIFVLSTTERKWALTLRLPTS